MRKKTTTTTTDVSMEDRKHVQGIEDNDGGGSGLTTGPVDWQPQRSVDFPCYQVANSNTVLSLFSCCLVLILFSSDSFFLLSARNTISTAIMRKCFCTECTLNLRMYPLRTGKLKTTSSHYQ